MADKKRIIMKKRIFMIIGIFSAVGGFISLFNKQALSGIFLISGGCLLIGINKKEDNGKDRNN